LGITIRSYFFGEFCILEYFSLGKGPFTGFHGRLEKIPATLGLSPPAWRWVECPEEYGYIFFNIQFKIKYYCIYRYHVNSIDLYQLSSYNNILHL
jgi:hypothetical protein